MQTQARYMPSRDRSEVFMYVGSNLCLATAGNVVVRLIGEGKRRFDMGISGKV